MRETERGPWRESETMMSMNPLAIGNGNPAPPPVHSHVPRAPKEKISPMKTILALLSILTTAVAADTTPWKWQDALVPDPGFALDTAQVFRVTSLEADGKGTRRAEASSARSSPRRFSTLGPTRVARWQI
jgi:hypothetical protein